MREYDVNYLIGGWFIGDFDKSVLKTTEFEVAYKTHYAGEHWESHYHAQAEEINYLIEGTMSINGSTLIGPTIFVLEKMEVADPIFITDVKLIVVKTPSIPGDKFTVSKGSN